MDLCPSSLFREFVINCSLEFTCTKHSLSVKNFFSFFFLFFFLRFVRRSHFYMFSIEFHFKCIISMFRFNRTKMLLFLSVAHYVDQITRILLRCLLRFRPLFFILLTCTMKRECSSEWKSLNSQLLGGARVVVYRV